MLYATFGIAILITLRLNNTANAIDAIDNMVAVRNIRLYDSAEGKDCAIPSKFSIDWCVCMYIPASAGPIEAPTILIKLLIPNDIPLYCLGVDRIITFIAPTLVNDNPVDRIARFAETSISLEWNINRPRKPLAVIIVPAIIGFTDPSFDIMKPEVGPNTNRY